nr:hypothetical protein [Tanacetum cinerariifolium]
MLEKSVYDSWASHIRLFIKGKKHGRMMLDSFDNGPLVYPTVEENGQTRPKKYSKLTEPQQLQDDCDVQATNIIIHGLPLDVYALVNHQEVAKDIWDRVKKVMKSTELSYKKLINDMHTIGMTMQQVQVSTKFLNALPSEWSNRERYPDSLASIANSPTLYNPSQSPQQLGNRGIATTSKGNVTAGPSRVVTCYNHQGEGHMARQCTQPKRPDPGISEALVAQQTIPYNSAFQTDDLDAYDSDYDNLSSAKAVLMANLSSCDPKVLSEAPYSNSYPNG